VRLALEEARAPYRDVTRTKSGMASMMRMLHGVKEGLCPFAPPFLRHGTLVVAQTANILLYLAPRHGLVPSGNAALLAAHQLQLTVADLVAEVHDTHHPVGTSLYYEDQRPEAKRNARSFTKERVPKYVGYFERVLEHGGGPHVFGRRLSYVDLSLFQVMSGLAYAFPRTMKRLARSTRRLRALRARVEERPAVAAYLSSERRLPFNPDGIFRYYPELDI
jgi:glutathione S-transferase